MHQLGSSLPWDVAGEKRIKHLKEGLGIIKLSPESASFNDLWSDPVPMKAVAGKH